MTILFFNKLYKAFCVGICLATSLYAVSPEEEISRCKPALLAQLNGQEKIEGKNCPIAQKLVFWVGIQKKPEQFSPKELFTFLTTHEHWPLHKKLCQQAEDVILKKGSFKEVLAWFNRYAPQTPRGVIAYAQALFAHNERKKAAKVVAKAWHKMDMTKMEEKKFLDHFTHLLQEKDHIARLYSLLWNENTEEARLLFVHVPVSVRKIAEARLSLIEQKDEALNKVKALPGKSLKDEGLVYNLTKWHRKHNNILEAAHILIKMPSSKLYADKWWKERSYIARELIEIGDYDTAYKVLQHHAAQPGSEAYSEAEWLLGWLALRFLNKPKGAKVHFESLYAHLESAMSKARVAYWAGRSHEALKNISLAAKWYGKAAKYKTVYYGQLAAAKLKEKAYPFLHSTPMVTYAEKKHFEQQDLVKAAYILSKLGKETATEISIFLSHIATHAKKKGERELAVHLAHSLSPRDIVWTAKKAGRKDPILLKKAYPVYKVPQKGQENPEEAFIMSIAYKESQFNPKAQSSAGAKGLLQLLPTTAALMADALGIEYNENQLFDPQHNLLLGSAFLSHLLEEFEHSYVLAIAAFNAGPGRVKRWLKVFGDPRKGDVDIIDWIELIPYAETRNYVMRILENITTYRCLKGEPKKTLIHDLKG